MRQILAVLQRLLVLPYYRINAGFFLALFLLLFGIISPKDTFHYHKAIMEEIARGRTFFWVAAAIWALYDAKCMLFCLRAFRKPSNGFLVVLQGLSGKRLYTAFIGTHILLYLPAAVYAVLTALVCIEGRHWSAAGGVILIQGVLIAAGAAVYVRRMDRIAREGFGGRLLHFLPGRRGRQPFALWLYAYTVQHRKGTLLLLKAGSLVLLQAMVYLNRESLQPEPTCLFILMIIAAHSLLPYYYVQFTEGAPWLRNLPLPGIARLAAYTGTYALLFLPELLFLVLHTRQALTAAAICSLYGLCVAYLTFYTAALYIPGLGVERYTVMVCAAFFISMLLVASFGIGVLSVIVACLSLLLFLSFYHRYEVMESE